MVTTCVGVSALPLPCQLGCQQSGTCALQQIPNLHASKHGSVISFKTVAETGCLVAAYGKFCEFCARPKNVMRALLRPNSGLRSLLATATRLTTTSTIFDNHHQQHPYFAVFSNVRHFSEFSTWLSEFARFR